jgi:hypothetical protein
MQSFGQLRRLTLRQASAPEVAGSTEAIDFRRDGSEKDSSGDGEDRQARMALGEGDASVGGEFEETIVRDVRRELRLHQGIAGVRIAFQTLDTRVLFLFCDHSGLLLTRAEPHSGV